MALFTFLYWLFFNNGGFITIYLIMGLVSASIGLFIGEMIHIHRKLNYFEKKEDAEEEYEYYEE